MYECVHLIVGINVEHVLDGTSLRVLGTLGDFIYLEPIATSLLREENHRIVHGGHIDVLYEVGLTSVASL